MSTYQVYIVADSDCQGNELRFDFGSPVSSIHECSTVVAQLEKQAIALQEMCADLDEAEATRVCATVHPAVAHFESCLPHARCSDGRTYVMIDEANWEEVRP